VIRFFAPGLPYPQGSHTAIVRGGKAVIIPAGSTMARKKHKAWRKAVHDAATAYIASDPIWTGPIDEPVGIVVAFVFPRLPSDRYRTRHVSNPDIDKLLRSTLDSLTTAGLIEESIRRSSEGSTNLDQVSKAIRSITENSGKMRTLMAEVSLSTGEQAKGIDQVSKSITQIDRVTQQTAALIAANSANAAPIDLTGAFRFIRTVTVVSFTGGTTPTVPVTTNVILGGERVLAAV